MNNICKNCGLSFSDHVLHFSNQIAQEYGYCLWSCMLADMEDKAWDVLRERTEINKGVK